MFDDTIFYTNHLHFGKTPRLLNLLIFVGKNYKDYSCGPQSDG